MNAPELPACSAFERQLIVATQAGLPLIARPYDAIAERLGVAPQQVIDGLAGLLARGVIRRIGAVPNHYAIGYTANGMSVWDIDDATVDAVGERVGRLPSVTHCYRRPRHLPAWPYNLFAMVHGRSRDDVQNEIGQIAALLECEFPGACRSRDVLFSTRILKKSGVRIGG